ncbi:hypothetical protein [uncultured Pseudomonas sp.]|uniref:hypothetical protein n=1 Tax=uncultured Pseudomonas sp. TaxID=114707 RepID=UPI0025FEEEE7|nr:hypothetical protein [uncultured Pseudomonas sp.]
MSLEFKNSAGPRSDVVSLQEMVTVSAPSELGCSKLESVMHLHKLFKMIAQNFNEKFLPKDSCWVSTPKNPENAHNRYSVSVQSVIEYLNKCVFPGTVECHRKDEITESVGDQFIVFRPSAWIEFIESLGVAWIPGKGASLVSDIPINLLKGSPNLEKTTNGFPYSTRQLNAMKKAAEHFWISFDHQRPPLQKTVSVFIAESLGLDGPNRTTNTLAAAIRPDDAPSER